MTDTEFIKFPKMARLSRDMIVTEKINGTNAQVFITPAFEAHTALYEGPPPLAVFEGMALHAGSRTRWITTEKDNHGFAKWAYEHQEELVQGLGLGRHFGEFWGSGISVGYGLPKGEKRFSLFNVQRWCLHGTEPQRIITGDPRQEKYQQRLPACVGLVPILYRGPFSTTIAECVLNDLERNGSSAAPGFFPAEGIVVHHVAGNVSFKKTIKNDAMPKSLVK